MATTGTPRSSNPSGGSRGGQPASPGRGANGRRKRPPRRTFWHKVKTFIQFVTFLVLVAAITMIVTIALELRQVPSSIDLTFNPPGRTLIYSSDGTQLAKLFVQNRQVVTIDRIPTDLQNATVAFEDKRFYQHEGVDVQGILRAVYLNIKSHDLKGEGGSTITQQLARNMGVEGLTREKSIQRKFHEWIVANQIEKSYTKQQILNMYLNQVNYGSGAYGVQAAAQVYFGKDVHDLDLAECALLAGLPNRPTYFNPYRDKDAAKRQRNIVLENMHDQGYITEAQYEQAIDEPIHLASQKPPSQGSQILHAPYFVNYVVDQLKKKYGDEYLMSGNLKVYTTLNWPMQQAAEDAVRRGILHHERGWPDQACLVALDPKTGEIKAMVGSLDYKTSQFNIVTQARRQPGSSFKPIVYAAAIDSGVVTEHTTVYDGPVSFKTAQGLWTPKDDDGYRYRSVDLREALAQSINVPAVKTLNEIGPQTAIHYARVMGIKSPLDPYLSLALGASGVTPLELADAYCVFASGGNRPEPTGISRVADADDKTIEDIPAEVENNVIGKTAVAQVDDMLRAVVTEGTGADVGRTDRSGLPAVPDARGKTGTTQGHKDVWFVGYTPQLVCAVWAGHPIKDRKTGAYLYGETMARNAWGASICVPIWKRFMLNALPIYQKAMAKEAQRAKPKVAAPAASTSTASPDDQNSSADDNGDYRRHAHDKDNADSGDADDSDAATATPKPATVTNEDGTVTANVDDNTGLLAPPGSPHSHRETFASGAQPTVMSPQYVNPTANEPTPVDHPSDSDTDSNSGAQDNTDAQPSDTENSNSGNNSDSTADAPATPRRRRHRHHADTDSAQAASPQYVTVRINPEDGLLATKWTPQYVEKTYIKGQEPHQYSHLDSPPPGEPQ